ncbi:MAG: multidrug efflux SMR transporter [Wenzhouxiangella sp.]|jgi:small multidrug resistance pump|nr:multidrug efflux SMR transporter [Wenzhouxiangella sp.]
MNAWIFLSIAIVAEVIGTSFLKLSEGFTRIGPSVAVVACYIVAFYMLALTLKTLPVGVAYAIWAGAGVALITLVGVFAFKQTLDFPAIAGIVMIVGGVLVIHLFSSAVAAEPGADQRSSIDEQRPD